MNTQNTWLPLWRSVLENDVWRHDLTAWHVFEALLVLADHTTGKWSGGLLQLSELCEVNRNTLYSALGRLESQQMVKRSSNARFTDYYICNFAKWQVGNSEMVKRSSNARQNSNNKLIKDTKVSTIPKTELEKALEDFKSHRKQLKRPMTSKAIDLLQAKLEKLAPQNAPRQIAILNQSIEAGWIGVFDLKQEDEGKTKREQALERIRQREALRHAAD